MMSSLSSTVSSLSSISEDSTFGVEGEDLPPTVPQRRKGSIDDGFHRAGSAITTNQHDSHREITCLDSIHEETPTLLEEQTENEVHRSRRRSSSTRTRSNKSGRRSHNSSRKRDNPSYSSVAEAEENREAGNTQRRRRRSSSSSSTGSRSKHSSHESGDGTKKSNSIRSPRRSSSHYRRSSSSNISTSSDVTKTQQEASETSNSPTRSNSQRGSSSHSSRTSSRTADLTLTSDEQEKLKENEMRSKSTATGNSRRLSSSTASSSSTRDAELLLKQTMAEERRRSRRSSSSSSHRRNSRHSGSSSTRSSASSSSRHSYSESSDTSISQFSRDLDRRGVQHEFRRNNNTSDEEETLSEQGSEEEIPGAYRVDSFSTNRMTVATVGASTIAAGDVDDLLLFLEEENSVTESTRSFCSNYSRGDILLSASSNRTLVTAEIAQDRTEAIEAAREQGRAEAARARASSNRGRPLVVAAVTSRRPKGAGNAVSFASRNKTWLIRFAVCLTSIVICGVAGYFAMNQKSAVATTAPPQVSSEQNNNGTIVPEDDPSAGLEATISFDPPTAEDCAMIANGTDVADQDDMFTQYVDMHVEITTESEQDTKLLVKLLAQQIQLNLMPFLIGCDDLDEDGNVIGNGVIDSVSNTTSPCLFKNNPLCLEVVLTVKIYLRREEDGSIVIDIMNELLLDEDLNETLDLPPTVQTAAVSLITPSTFSPGTDDPTDDNDVEVPSWSPTAMTTIDSTIGPDAPVMPNTPSPSMGPTARKMPSISAPDPTAEPISAPDPTVAPISGPSPTVTPVSVPGPTVAPISAPSPTVTPVSVPGPTVAPASAPSPTVAPASAPGPTVEPISAPDPTVAPISAPSPTVAPALQQTPQPTPGPSPAPSSSPVLDNQTDDGTPLPAPSAVPSLLLTQIPSMAPSSTPSATPTVSSSASPSWMPTDVPSRSPSESPSSTPSALPTTSSPSAWPSPSPSAHPSELPTPSGFYWVACGRPIVDGAPGCNGQPATVQNANHVTVGGIPTALDEHMLAVRCCSETLLPGFEGPSRAGCPYNKSRINDQCHKRATYYEAESLCSSIGARLCTLDEVESTCAGASGCGHNNRMLWTSTQGSL